MNKFKIGDKVKVIADHAGHGQEKGKKFIIKEIRKRKKENEHDCIEMINCTYFFYNTDIEKIHKTIHKKGNFIITDPSYIIENEKYEEIKNNLENQKYPIKTRYNETSEEIIIHIIEKTPYGKDSEYTNENETIENQSGLLCIAENKNEWLNEILGMKIETLKNSMDIFPHILNKF